MTALKFVTGLLTATLASSAVFAADTAEYPNKPIKVIVFLPPGSGPDSLARALGTELARQLQQPVVVENRPGASGNIALSAVAKAPADGYTLAVVASGPMAINVGLYKDLPYDPRKDFTAITELATSPNALVVAPALNVKTVAELVALGQARKGELTYSSGGNGTVVHLSGAQFSSITGIEARHIPYKGTPQGVLPIISGEVSYGVYPIPNVANLATQGKLRALAVTGTQRSPQLPDTPTTRDVGLADFTPTTTYGVVGPAQLPAAVVEKLHRSIAKVMAEPALRGSLTQQGFDVATSAKPSDYARKIAAEVDQWVPLIQKVGATLD